MFHLWQLWRRGNYYSDTVFKEILAGELMQEPGFFMVISDDGGPIRGLCRPLIALDKEGAILEAQQVFDNLLNVWDVSEQVEYEVLYVP